MISFFASSKVNSVTMNETVLNTDSFEYNSLPSYYIYSTDSNAISNNWAISSNYANDGFDSLRSPIGNISYGSYVLYNKAFVNGSVDSWVYMSGSNDMMAGLTIRSDNVNCIDAGNAKDICNGYIFRFEHIHQGVTSPILVLDRLYNGAPTTLAKYQLSSWFQDIWTHLKLEANGTMLTGYLGYSSTLNPVITYNTASDPIQHIYGDAGVGARVFGSAYGTYFDNLTIKAEPFNSSNYPTSTQVSTQTSIQTSTQSSNSKDTTSESLPSQIPTSSLPLLPILLSIGILVIIRRSKRT